MQPIIKICGVTTPGIMECAIAAGASHMGLVFHAASPRDIDPAAAGTLARAAKGRILTVGVLVDPEDDFLDSLLSTVPLDALQLHGGESPETVARIKARFGLPVIKALPASGRLAGQAHAFVKAADMLLIDAPVREGALPGGRGEAWDRSELMDFALPLPWILSGGLTPETVGAAICAARPGGVDVSSGVERARGLKDAGKITAFVKAARHGFTALGRNGKQA